MAGTPQGTTQARASDAKHYVEYEEYVDFQLEKTRSIVKRTDILTTLTTLAVAVIAYLFAFVVFDQWIIAGGFGYASRVVLLGVVLAVVTATLIWRVLFPLLRQVHPLYAARVIEKSDPQLKSNLVNFVDVKLSNADSAPAVMKSMQKRAAVELSHIDVEEAVDHRPLLRVAYALLAVVIVAAAYIVWSPKDPFASVRRALLPTSPIEVATETTISDVNPNDDSDVPARTVLTIEADVRGKDADHAQILYTTTDHKYVDQTVEMRRVDESLSRFRGVLNGENGRGLLQSLTYRIVAGDAHTRDYFVNVIQPPGARLEEVHYVFPSYMQLEEKTTSGGDIDGWEGAVVTVKATANVPVKTATIVQTDTEDVHAKGEEISMQVTDGTKLSASWKLEFRSDGTSARFYHVQVKTEKGEVDPDPTQYTFRIRPDQRPEVALLAPAGDLTMPANGIIPLVIQASDPDFQLRSVTLKAERAGEAFSDQRLFEDQDLGQSFRGKHDFRLEPLQLKPGESILFWIEVKDNKQPTANRANTPRIKVEIGKPVTTAEAQKQLAEEKQKQQDQLASSKDAPNADNVGKQPPRDAGDDFKPDDSQPRQDRPEPGDEKPSGKKQSQKQKDQENADDDASQDSGNRPDGKARPPANEEEALQRLLQKQQQEQPADQKPDDQKQPSDNEKSTDKADAGKSNTDKSNRDQAKKSGQDSDKSKSSKNQDSTNDQSQSGNDGADDKPGADQRQADPDNPKKQPGADKSQAGKTQKQDKKPQDADNKRQSKSNDEKDQAGDKGPANDKKDGGSGKKDKGDQPGHSSKAADSKPKAKPKAGDQQKQPGNDASDKPNDSKKAGGDQQANDKGAEGDDKKPADQAGSPKDNDPGKSDPGKNDPGNDKSATDDSEKGDAGIPDSGKKEMEKKDSEQEKPGADDQSATDQKKQGQGGAGKNAAEDSDPASNSSDQSKAKGSPGKSDKPEGDQQSGDSKGEKSQKKGQGPAKPSDDPDPSGKEEPAEDDPNAKKKKATGNEQGEASGSEEADPDATKANNDLKKKEGSQPGAQKPSDGSDPGKKSNQKRQPQEGTKKGSPDADQADRAPDGKGPTEKTDELDEPSSKRPDKKPGGESEKRPGQPPDVGNKPMPGEGRKQGQKSEQPQDGEKGSSSATDQGKPGANKPGEGDKSDEPGNTDPTSQKTGQPGDKKKGQGSTTKPSDDVKGQKKDGPGDETGKKSSQKSGQGKPGDQSGQEGDGGEKSGQNKGKSGGDKAGKNSDGKDGPAGSGDSGSKPGDSQGKGSGQSSKPGAPGAGQQQSGSGISSPPAEGDPAKGQGPGSDADTAKPRERSADEPPTPKEEQANLEAARKATNLVLQKLKSQLERGEVDQDLMDELGWKNKKDVERFVKYLEKGLSQPGDDNSPEAEARRMQFEETLRSMELGSETQRRSGSTGQERAIEQIGAKNATVPREYQKVWESYTRSLSKQAEKSEAKAKGQDKAKAAKGK